MNPSKPVILMFALLLTASLACSLVGGTGQNRVNLAAEATPEPTAAPVVFAAELGRVYGLAADADGNLYAPGTDGNRSVLWKIDPGGHKEQLAEIVDRGDVLSSAGLAAHARSLANVAIDGAGRVWLTSRKHGAGFVVQPDKSVAKLYLNTYLSVSMSEERLSQGVAWDAGAGRLYLITSGPERALGSDNHNFITALTVSEQPDGLAQEVTGVKDMAGNQVKAIKAAGLPLAENGNGLMTCPDSTLYFLGEDSLFQVNLADGALHRLGEPLAGQNLWGGVADNTGVIYLSSNVADYTPEANTGGQGTVWRLGRDGARTAFVNGIAAPIGLAWHNGFLYIADRATGSIIKAPAGPADAPAEVANNTQPAPTSAAPIPTSTPPAPTNTPAPPTTAPVQPTVAPTSTPLPPTSTPLLPPTWTPVPVAVQVEPLAQIESNWAKQVTWSPDGQHLAVGTYHVCFYNAQTLQQEAVIDAIQWANSISYSPDGSRLASASFEGVQVWDTIGLGEIQTLPGSKQAEQVIFSPDGSLLAATIGGAVRLWDANSGQELRTLPAGNSAGPVAFSPDGSLLAAMAGTAGQDIKVWETTGWTELYTLSGHSNWVKSIAFAPDGKTIATGSVDQSIRLWDTAGGQQIRVLTGHTGQVDGVAFSPDGRLLASASWDLTVRLWDVASGAEAAQLTGHTGWIATVAFSPDGAMLASGATDQAVRVWQVMIQ